MKRSETSLSDNLGEQFGPYKLVRRLGVGGMAETFVAVRSGPGDFTQRVCLKLVLPFFREDEDFTRLFYREATLAAKLRHRNIVGVMDFGEFEDTPYMALELVDGLDLRDILDGQKRQQLSAEYVTLFGLELADALEHAHNPPSEMGFGTTGDDVRGIVHRDISPSNVLVSRQGEILLTDFGVAKAISDNSRKQSAVKGKVPYMSPEQLRAESLDGRADLFALGVVLFEALAGQRPYEGPHDPATIMLILKGEHPPLQTLAPDAPPGLCDVIERLIDPDKGRRPATAAALIEALDDFAPSPRVRQNLGRLVRQLCEKAEQKRSKKGSGLIGAKTEVLPHADTEQAGAPTEPSSRVEAWTSGPMEEDELPAVPPAPAPPVSEPLKLVRPPRGDTAPVAAAARQPELLGRPYQAQVSEPRQAPTREHRGQASRRKLGVFVAAFVLMAGSVAALSVAFWPSSEPAAAPLPSAAQTPKAAEATTKAREPEALPESEPQAEEAAPLERPTERVPPSTASAEAQPPVKPQPKERQATPKPVTKERPRGTASPRPVKPAPEPQAKAPARLTITVFPWGDIWIDGQPWGPAPLKSEALPPGTYKISAGQGAPTQTQVIRLKPNQRRTVRFDLPE